MLDTAASHSDGEMRMSTAPSYTVKTVINTNASRKMVSEWRRLVAWGMKYLHGLIDFASASGPLEGAATSASRQPARSASPAGASFAFPARNPAESASNRHMRIVSPVYII